MIDITLVNVDSLIEFKKPHPCGENRWKIIRLGADIRIKCQGCGASVLFPRSEFEKKCKKVVQRANDALA